jgi:hypothetical protein
MFSFGFCLGGVWYVGTRAPPADQPGRAGVLVRDGGALTALGYAAIWLPYAYRAGIKRRKEK